jgi:hypothetical protein
MNGTRLMGCILAACATAGCVDTPRQAHQDCHLESGWLDATQGCSERAGYDDCWKVCADGTRTRLGSAPSAAPAPSPR